MKPNTKALALLQAKLAALEAARDAGRDHFKSSPDEMLIEVSRWAALRFSDNAHIIAFMQGYSDARIRHDEYQQEKRQ